MDVTIVRNWEESLSRTKQASDPNSNSPKNIERFDGRKMQFKSSSSPCVSVTEMFQKSQKILVIGDAGTGKTTWCHMLCHFWANRDCIDDWNKLRNTRKIHMIFLQKNFDYCFIFHLREVEEDSVELKLCSLLEIPDCSEKTFTDFITANASRMLFILGLY